MPVGHSQEQDGPLLALTHGYVKKSVREGASLCACYPGGRRFHPRKGWCLRYRGGLSFLPTQRADLRTPSELSCFKPAAASHMRIIGPQCALDCPWMRITETALNGPHCVRQNRKKSCQYQSSSQFSSSFHCFFLKRCSVYRAQIAVYLQVSSQLCPRARDCLVATESRHLGVLAG